MTGFKDGASSSPFDDDEDADEPDTTPNSPTAANPDRQDTEAANLSPTENDGLPWIYRRENACDGRPKTKQLHLQETTARQETQFRSDVETELDESIELTDLREAAVMVAMNHVDEVAAQLREWGYDAD